MLFTEASLRGSSHILVFVFKIVYTFKIDKKPKFFFMKVVSRDAWLLLPEPVGYKLKIHPI